MKKSLFKKVVLVLVVGAIVFGFTAYYRRCDVVNVVTTEFCFTPKIWTVSAGRQVKITITNNGYAEHQWAVLKPSKTNEQPSEEDIEDDMLWDIQVEAGETKTEVFTAPDERGNYPIVCGIPGHLERGMEATLVVK